MACIKQGTSAIAFSDFGPVGFVIQTTLKVPVKTGETGTKAVPTFSMKMNFRLMEI